jgi:hypothetical protein
LLSLSAGSACKGTSFLDLFVAQSQSNVNAVLFGSAIGSLDLQGIFVDIDRLAFRQSFLCK